MTAEERYARLERASIMRESGESYSSIASCFGICRQTAWSWLNPQRNKRELEPRYDVAPFRDAFEQSREPAASVALRLGWVTCKGRGDGPRVRRVLGLRPYRCRQGRTHFQSEMQRKTALAFCEALNLDPVDFDV